MITNFTSKCTRFSIFITIEKKDFHTNELVVEIAEKLFSKYYYDYLRKENDISGYMLYGNTDIRKYNS